jgi:putative ABC transport system permease protein
MTNGAKMSFVIRGVKNSFRNVTRTLAIILILGASIGLAVTMLVSLSAVQQKIKDIKASIGNIITISPAGARGFMGGGEPLTQSSLDKLSDIKTIRKITLVLNTQLTSSDTNLESAITAGTLGERQKRAFENQNGEAIPAPEGNTGSTSTRRREFKMGIFSYGSDDLTQLSSFGGGSIKLSSGEMPNASGEENVAIVGSDLATKNSLKVGSTFTAYGTTITVKGIFDAGNKFSNNIVVFPLKTLQKLSGQTGEISSAIVTVDSIENLESTLKEIQTALGDTADVVSQENTANNAVEPLQNISNITVYGLIGSLGAGSVTILLLMIIIVRERKREIGILKALGSSNYKIMLQYASESLTLVGISSIVGFIFGILFSNNILGMLVSGVSSGRGPGGGMGRGMIGGMGNMLQLGSLKSLQTSLSWENILIGVGAVMIIAIIGSAVPSFLISKIKPNEVLKGE